MARRAIPGWFFVVAVVQRRRPDGTAEYLLVEERKHGGGFYLPAGRVEPGEGLVDAMLRETLEESGVRVVPEGVLRVEHGPSMEATRLRVVFLARPEEGSEPRTEPNEHTLGARFVTLDTMRSLPLRGREVVDACAAVERGAAVHPLDLIVYEGSSWSVR